MKYSTVLAYIGTSVPKTYDPIRLARKSAKLLYLRCGCGGHSTKFRFTAAIARGSPKLSEGYPVGLVVRARLNDFPWWPAVVVDRKKQEKNLKLEPDETLPVEKVNTRMVEFL